MKKTGIIMTNIIIIGLIIGALYFWGPVQQSIEYTLQISDNQELLGVESFEQLERYKQDLHREYQSVEESIDKKFNVIMVVIGISLSVWVSLNIYSVVQREEINKLNEDLENIKNEFEIIKEETNSINKGIKTNINVLKEETEKSISLVKIETNYLKFADTNLLKEKKQLIEESILLVEKFPDIKDDNFKAELYLYHAGVLANIFSTLDSNDPIAKKLIDKSYERLDKALKITTNIALESNIHQKYCEIAYSSGELYTAYYHAKEVYDENPWDTDNFMQLIEILDNIKEPRFFLRLLNLTQERIEYDNIYSTKEEIKENIKAYDIKNIYKSKYGKEFSELLE